LESLTKKVLWFGAAYVVIAAGTAGYLFLSNQLGKRDSALDAQLIARGEKIYAEQCAKCHGANLEGQKGWETQLPNGTYPAPPQNETGHTWQHPDQQLFDYIKQGGGLFAPRTMRSNMPGFGRELSDSDIWAVIAYIKSRWPEEIRQAQIRTNVSGFGHH
jgi:mono/diheme cytochrome c family protein